MDHSCIYLFIAGTYTPILLHIVQGAAGWTMFGIVWGIAVCGVVFKTFFASKFLFTSTILYILMGWLIVFAWGPLSAHLAPSWSSFINRRRPVLYQLERYSICGAAFLIIMQSGICLFWPVRFSISLLYCCSFYLGRTQCVLRPLTRWSIIKVSNSEDCRIVLAACFTLQKLGGKRK